MKDFFWGVSTASLQIEGAYKEDGRVLSIWDELPDGVISNNDNPHNGCDFFHKYKDDIKIAKSLGINSFRISISWPRVINDKNEVNLKGINFYVNLIEEIIKNGLEPFVTLYHWDLPKWVQDLGGWESETIVSLFENYVLETMKAIGNKVKYYFIFNEPQIFLTKGYYNGEFPPNIIHPESLTTYTLNFLKATSKAYDIVKKYAKPGSKIGIASANSVFIPKSEKRKDIKKAYQKTFETDYGKMWNCWYTDPLYLKKSPKIKNAKINRKILKEIYREMDFFGINIYSPAVDNEYIPIHDDKTSMGWIIDERCIYWAIKYYEKRYHKPILISENGTSMKDNLINGKVHDDLRCDYIKNYTSMLLKAKSEGSSVIGYQCWSLLDNFEWTSGYEPRFGLVYVDYQTQERYLKDSFFVFKDIIKNN